MPPLRIDRRPDGVVILTLDLPDRRNAMTEELTDAWTAAVTELATDRSVRCVVVTGAGTVFCAGGDLSWLATSPEQTVDDLRDRMLGFYRRWLVIRDLQVPTIAALNGPAVGAGLCLALACDLRYATPRARMSMPFTMLGMHAGMAATWLLPEAVGLPVARELLFTGRTVQPDEALRLGLINGVYDEEALTSEVLGIAERIASAAPIATRLTKAALARGGHRSIDDALQWEAMAQPITMTSEDLTEGLTAQREKRPPRFTGR